MHLVRYLRVRTLEDEAEVDFDQKLYLMEEPEDLGLVLHTGNDVSASAGDE